MFKGQGAVEYLLVLGAVIVIAVVLMLMISGINQAGQCQGTSNIDNFRDLTIQLSNASGYLGEVTEYCDPSNARCTDFQFKSGSVVSRENTPWRQFKTAFTLPLQNDACFTGLDQIWVRFGMRARAPNQTVYIDEVCLTELGSTACISEVGDPSFESNDGSWEGYTFPNEIGNECPGNLPGVNYLFVELDPYSTICKSGKCVKMSEPPAANIPCNYWFQQQIYDSSDTTSNLLSKYGGKKMEFSYWYRSEITS